MTVKLLLLKSGEDVIADVTEMGSGDKQDRRVVGYFLNKPCIVKMRDPNVLSEENEGPAKAGFAVSLFPWMPLSKEDLSLIHISEPTRRTPYLGTGKSSS